MEQIINQYKKWKLENPDEDYQYDCINEFFDDLGRGDLQTIMDFAEKQWNIKS